MNVIVFGLGKNFENDRKLIERAYSVRGLCDSNEEKTKLYKGIDINELSKHIGETDYILITPAMDTAVEIADLLTQEYQINRSRLVFWNYEKITRIKETNNEFPLEFHGQYYTDAYLYVLFSEMGYKPEDVKYLDIGSNDPIEINNTYSFYVMGASGVLVDPLMDIQKRCEIIRKRDRFIRAAIVSDKKPGQRVFYESMVGGGLSSFNPENNMLHGIAEDMTPVLVDCLNINDLLESLDFVPDLLDLDCEGLDSELLAAIDYDRFPIKVIVWEGAGNMIGFMQQKGYRLFVKAGCNSICVLERYFSW